MEDQDWGFADRSRSMDCVSRTKPTGMKDEEWAVLKKKARSLIRLCVESPFWHV